MNTTPLLSDKKLVIIGGTSGIGLSAAQAFLQQGAQVVVVGLHPESVEKAEQQLGRSALVQQGDASLPGTARSAIETCLQSFGGFHGLYHVAGGSGRKWGDGPLHELTLEGWNKTLEWNLTSLMLSNQAAVTKFLELQQPGSILNLGSVLGFSPSPQYFTTHAYAAAKSAIIGFSKSVAAAYAHNDIRINVLTPGLVDTNMAQRALQEEAIVAYVKKKQPLQGGRVGLPADLDGLAVYFMSDLSGFTTGQTIAVDGGWSVS